MISCRARIGVIDTLGKLQKRLEETIAAMDYTILLRANTDVDVIYDLCKSIAADIAAVYNCSNNIIIFVKCIIIGENYHEPEYVKSTMTNRPYPPCN